MAISQETGREQLVFARKASGLVRGLSMTDAFAVGFMNQGITPSIWTMITWGLGTYLTGSLFWATVISLVMVGFGFPLVWGILSGSMPRSGGEYIYNSRIINPIVAIAESFGNAFVMIFWVYILAPWVADPGLVIIAEYQGLDWLYNAETGQFFGVLGYEWGVFLVATITNVLAFSTLVFGVKIFAHIQKVVMIFALGGAAIVTASLTFTSKAGLAENWDKLAAEYGSLKYDEVVPAVSAAIGETVPTSATLYGTLGVMVAGSWLFAYAYFCVFVAGEVKRPDKTLILANFFAVLVPAVVMIWTSLAMYRVMDFDFVSATAWIDNSEGIEGYTLPFLPSYMSLAYIAHPNWLIALAAGGSFMLFCYWYVALSYLAFPRIIFAWGMDRMGPKWFTDINPRWASPVKNYLLCFVLCQIAIALYTFWIGGWMQSLTVTGMEIVSVWGVTTVAALLFPYLKRSRGIWESSPYKTWKFLGVPMITWGALVSFVYLGILFYFLILTPEMRDSNGRSWILYGVVWLMGIAWYFFWKARSKSVGVDVSLTYGELPPE
jgi:basic amino acid/polyamine antiporter, APA family